MATRIGRMRKRVAIYARADTEAGTYSGLITRTLVATVWAQVRNVTGTMQVDSRNAGAGVTHTFIIRNRSDITKKNELKYNGRWYQIATIQRDGDERNRFLIIDCNELDTVGTLDESSPE